MWTDIEINTAYPILSRIEFTERIRRRQEELKDFIELHDHGLSAWTEPHSGKVLSQGCQACRSGGYLCFYAGKKCNLDCTYCAQGTKKEKWAQPEAIDLINDKYHIEEIMDTFNNPEAIWKGSNVRCIEYSGGEPFIYLDKVLKLSCFVSRYYNHIYQMIVTNGLLVTRDKLKELHDCGVNEIKFHIGATHFSKKVLDNLAMAREIMDYVSVITPPTPELKEFLIDKKGIHWLEGAGLHQLGLSELGSTDILHMSEMNKVGDKRALEYFQKLGELYIFDSVVGKSITGKDLSEIYVSPAISREITYDIMKYAVENKTDVVVNDCSQDRRHLQRIQRNTMERKIDIIRNSRFQDAEYIRRLLTNIDEQRIKMLDEYNGPQAKDWIKPLIQDISKKDEDGYHLKLKQLAKVIGNYLA
jgi:hypothetical protein